MRAFVASTLALGACAPNNNGADAAGGDAASGDAAVDAPVTSDVAPLDEGPTEAGPPPVVRGFDTEISYDLEAGAETTMCVVQRLGNINPAFVRRVTASLGEASHHLIVYRSRQTEERRTPFRCSGFSGVLTLEQSDTPMLIAQQAESELRMPDNVGLTIEANQMMMLEFHSINLSRERKTVRGRVHIDAVDQTTAGYFPADVMFWGNTNINIPARSAGTVEFYNRPRGGANIFGLTSHTHHFGRRATIHIATSEIDTAAGTRGTTFRNIQDTRMLHESTNWSDPPFTRFETPLRLTGNEGFHLKCEYNNTSDERVRFGESANQEMCFMWAYYYPAPRGTQICAIDLSPEYDGVLCFPP